MAPRNGFSLAVTILLAGMLVAMTVPGASAIQAYLGDTVPLSGYSPTSNSVYLFLTGPNLPVNGVALNDITRRSDQGGFTVVQVKGEDDTWSYKWHTSGVNGRLDEGTYTVWVVNGPNDRSNLQNAEYATISVTLGSPTISVSTPAPSCSMVITSEPAEASVSLNGQYRGKTPLTVDSLDPGQYEVRVSKFGFYPYTTMIQLKDGEIGQISATLPAERGALAVNTTPPGAQVSVDGAIAGISPVVLTNILPGNHTLSLSKDGYVPAEQQVFVTAGATIPVTVALSPVSPLPSLPIKAPGLTAATIVGLCAAVAAGICFRQRSR